MRDHGAGTVKCPDCWAYLTGSFIQSHVCPPWLKAMVDEHKKKQAYVIPSDEQN